MVGYKYIRNKDDIVTQRMHDLIVEGTDYCKKDIKAMRRVLKKYKYSDQDYNICLGNDATIDDAYDALQQIRKTCEEHHDKGIVISYVFAGHGMLVDGEQVLLFNEYDPYTHFYKMQNFEHDIRNIAEEF